MAMTKSTEDPQPRRPPFLSQRSPKLLQLFVVVGSLASCSGQRSAERLAERACEIFPAVAIDGVGQALAREVILDEEQALWRSAPPGAALSELGPEGLGVIRANSGCRATSSEANSEGRRVHLVRTEPDLSLMPLFTKAEVRDLPTLERELILQVVNTPMGPRVRVDLARALSELDEVRTLARSGRTRQAIEALDALEVWFGDPTLRWERELLTNP